MKQQVNETRDRLRTGARTTRDAVIRVSRALRNGASGTWSMLARGGRAVRRTTHASGAGRTGLAQLIELTALHSAGDALVAVALAGTLFFGLPVNEAQGQVALYLLISMAPFAVVAPFIGPALDRLRTGRRFIIAGTLLARGLLCWGMAGAVRTEDIVTLFPAAFGVLVLSKAYNISRSAVTPRVLPTEITLVTANARCSLAGVITATIAAPLAVGLAALAGPEWVLRAGTLLFLLAVVPAMRLPNHVDTPEIVTPDVPGPSGTDPEATDPAGPAPDTTLPLQSRAERLRAARNRWRTLVSVGPVVAEAIEVNAALRVFSGYMLLFLAFLLRGEGFRGMDTTLVLAGLAGAAGAGGIVGTAVGSLLRSRAPHQLMFGTLALAAVAAGVCAVFFGFPAAVIVAFAAAFCQAFGKLGMDAIVQREIGEEIRSSTFAVTETLHQLAWVAGGLLGLGVSLAANGTVGLGVVAGALAITFVVLAIQRVRRKRAVRAARTVSA
ncbi:MAG: MFS transporter [Streptosporangiales bacterium]|nr:MFS transporter [Streptosporangiales bacterium]